MQSVLSPDRSINLRVREATPNDISEILWLIQQKAEFDTAIGSFNGTLLATETQLQKTLFGHTRFARVLLAETGDSQLDKLQAIGFALYYFCYSSFKAQPNLWIDDLYVDCPFRSRGVGSLLMSHLGAAAEAQGCSHLGWHAWQDNDRAIAFYQRTGGRITEAVGKRLLFQWDGQPVGAID